VNLVSSSRARPIGDEFISNPKVHKLTFTGSTEVGKELAAAAAKQVKRVSMELGGHAPFIVFADADPVHAAKGVAALKFLNMGQACISPNRIFVHRSIAEPFIATVTARVAALKAGSGLVDGNTVGPLIDEDAYLHMEAQVKDAVAKGATVAQGGTRLTGEGFDGGYFYAATVLTDVTTDMTIYREETFGPIAPIIVYEDEDEVVRMANDTEYGLAAYVYTKDIKRAWNTVEKLRFGIIGVNDVNPTAAAAPFGGMKESGLGREGGAEGIGEYLETKLVGITV